MSALRVSGLRDSNICMEPRIIPFIIRCHQYCTSSKGCEFDPAHSKTLRLFPWSPPEPNRSPSLAVLKVPIRYLVREETFNDCLTAPFLYYRPHLGMSISASGSQLAVAPKAANIHLPWVRTHPDAVQIAWSPPPQPCGNHNAASRWERRP